MIPLALSVPLVPAPLGVVDAPRPVRDEAGLPVGQVEYATLPMHIWLRSRCGDRLKTRGGRLV